jgi:hypothetical protein
MRPDAGEKLRKMWAALGNPPCRHPKLELESSTEVYLTGRHVCTTCGAALALNQISESSVSKSTGEGEETN